MYSQTVPKLVIE